MKKCNECKFYPKNYELPEVADILRVTYATVCALIRTGKIAAKKGNENRQVVKRSSLLKFINTNSTSKIVLNCDNCYLKHCLLTVAEIDIPNWKVWKLMSDGKIDFVQVGRRRMIAHSQLEGFYARQK